MEIFLIIYIPIFIFLFFMCLIILINSFSKNNRINTTLHSDDSLVSEIKRHNAEVEQRMYEQEHARLDEAIRNQMPNKSLSEQFDTRISNVFKNPWDGIL